MYNMSNQKINKLISILNNQDLELHLTDEVGNPFQMIYDSDTTTNATWIQYTFKFSVVYYVMNTFYKITVISIKFCKINNI